jgi:hypothetical protein
MRLSKANGGPWTADTDPEPRWGGLATQQIIKQLMRTTAVQMPPFPFPMRHQRLRVALAPSTAGGWAMAAASILDGPLSPAAGGWCVAMTGGA